MSPIFIATDVAAECRLTATECDVAEHGGARLRRSASGGRTRGVAQLIADVTDFMSLQAGDVLLLGSSPGAPLAKADQEVAVESPLLGRLSLRLAAEAVNA